MRGVEAREFGDDFEELFPPVEGELKLTDKRRNRFRQVLARRSRKLAVVIEDCYDPHNATAVVRTCDCFGVHRVHVVSKRNTFKVNRRVSQGSHLYLDLRVNASIEGAYEDLRKDGYKIYVSDLAAGAVVGPGKLREEMADNPLAIVFGSEGDGVSETASHMADGAFLLPMVGFAQSLNLSVSAAITIYTLRRQELVADAQGDLSIDEQAATMAEWIGRSDDDKHKAARITTDRRGEEVEAFRKE